MSPPCQVTLGMTQHGYAGPACPSEKGWTGSSDCAWLLQEAASIEDASQSDLNHWGRWALAGLWALVGGEQHCHLLSPSQCLGHLPPFPPLGKPLPLLNTVVSQDKPISSHRCKAGWRIGARRQIVTNKSAPVQCYPVEFRHSDPTDGIVGIYYVALIFWECSELLEFVMVQISQSINQSVFIYHISRSESGL